MKRRMRSVSGINTRIINTPKAEDSDAVPSSQYSQSSTAKTSFSRLASIKGMEKERSAWTATHTHPAAKAGNRSGKVMAKSVRMVPAPQT